VDAVAAVAAGRPRGDRRKGRWRGTATVPAHTAVATQTTVPSVARVDAAASAITSFRKTRVGP